MTGSPTRRAGSGPLVCVVGARPNCMKMAPLMRAFRAEPSLPPAVLVHTGQHHDIALLSGPANRGNRGRTPKYWDGHAAGRIARHLAGWLGARTAHPEASEVAV